MGLDCPITPPWLLSAFVETWTLAHGSRHTGLQRAGSAHIAPLVVRSLVSLNAFVSADGGPRTQRRLRVTRWLLVHLV